MNDDLTSDFDFDMWRALAETDPTGFESRRRVELDQVIAQAPLHLQPRLKGLQWQLDMTRQRHRHALGGCLAAFNQMWDAVYGERGLLSALNSLHGGADVAPPAHTATVVPLKPAEKRMRG